MSEFNYFQNLSEQDKGILLGLWYCPIDNFHLEKSSGEISISRGIKKANVALNNAVAMKRIAEEHLNHVQMISTIAFQIIPDDYIIFTQTQCPQCDYAGLAPKLPIQMLGSGQRTNQLIQSLIEESNRVYKQQSSGGGSSFFRRGSFFLWIILISLLPLIVFFVSIALDIIYYFFQLGL